MRRFLLAVACAVLSVSPSVAFAAGVGTQDLVILDNDFEGPATSNIDSLIPLLNNPHITLLGVTTVIGDDWENAESAHLRRFLEIARQTQIPVYEGATLPLINSRPLMRLREEHFGTIPWKGAWGGLGSIEASHDTQPPLGPLPEGEPKLKAQPLPAALFMIQQVHAHPHQVTIIEAGPMTNLALAIRLDPDFAALARQLIFMGGYVGLGMEAATGNADNASDFNLLFDPEAAHITLTAPWPAITSVSNVSNDVFMSKADMEKLAASRHTPVTDYLAHYYAPMPMWDETTTLLAADPSLIKKSVAVYMDVDLASGPHQGSVVLWSDANAPKKMGVRKVHIVQEIDRPRLLAAFADDARNAMGKN
ncbi:nucleoside hydrolase [Acidomonas methanolica]|uniref:Nucleoside hydrolase n=1 Tax=Acidomonas methanolica NBRC 104435 TaxID=1231351 RepID=A0A023D1K2_ACIMT|nr:nucleoside hydrolase [Acidomonas methanolica]MBU2653340.1 nucleoside hydrolase [Acidomonas methanolica]TCS32291.1 inosine-uridine nucleoside N-ribohydrolase [Acidomonas methanolica]GAJ27666.1 nucleoside hydrolase [Acidomonas methanolica NBRC 104435]GBQ59230.1 nucleoside hydrolase [Acidomonas methanolica]GEK97728.1 nucleoside hydrolase [Acidomonas methanolica NBRC 104435]